MKSLKNDQGKPPLHLLDPEFLIGTAAVLDFGQRKYSAWNWARGTFAWSRLYSALLRHLLAFWSGEEIDSESGLPHLDHAACCLMFLRRYASDALGTDDRHIFERPVHSLSGAEPIETLNPRRGSGSGGSPSRPSLRREFREGTRQASPGSLHPSELHDERSLDQTSGEQARSLHGHGSGAEINLTLRIYPGGLIEAYSDGEVPPPGLYSGTFQTRRRNR